MSLNDDIEDDMKLFDLKQRLDLVKPKFEALEANLCRTCFNEDGCVNLYQQTDDEGLDLAQKLRIIGGIEVSFLLNCRYFRIFFIQRFLWQVSF